MIKRSRPHSTGYGHPAPQFPRPPAGGCMIAAIGMLGAGLALIATAAATAARAIGAA